MAADPVDDLRELDRYDAELGARAERLSAADAGVAEVRTRAEAIAGFFAAYPHEDDRLRRATADTEHELDRRRRERAEAQAAVDAAHDEEARRHAAHALERADDHIAVAEANLARAREAHDHLEREAAALPAELERLEARAREIAAETPEVPEPGSGPQGLVDWASRAHAALFVGAGSVDSQRERVIREANELATMLLGEPTYGSTVAQARARVEAARLSR